MFSGEISLEVLSATNLPDIYPSLNTYVQVKVDDLEVFQTTTAKGTFNPIWNEYKEFDKENIQNIRLTIFDDDKEKGVIAECTLALCDILVEQIGRDSLKLNQSLSPQGELQLVISLKEFEKTGALKRRDAVEKIYRVQGHNFKKVYFPTPTFCSECTDFIWGVGKQGMKCSGCSMAVHKRCHKLVLAQCRAATQLELGEGEMSGRFGLDRKHDFVETTYFIPTFCDHDGTLLSGMFNKGYKCKSCKLNVHKECRELVPTTCGVDKLAHALIVSQQKTDINSRISSEIKSEEEMEQMRKAIVEKIKENMKLLLIQAMSGPRTDESKQSQKPSLDDFRLIKTLGQGAYGKVVLAQHINESNFYAIKILEKPQIVMDDEIQLPYSERDILKLGSENRFLTKLHSSFQTSDYIFFAMEYLNGGDLMFHLMETNRFPEERARFYTAELVLGLQFLHSKGIIYRDLKLENVMLTSEGHVKLADFGMIKENIRNGAEASTFCGTPSYIAPEMLNGRPYGGSVDWWSLGILLYQMMAGRSPFDDEDEEKLYKLIQYKQVPIPSSFSREAQDIIRGLLQKNPKNRLGCKEDIGDQELKDHPFFGSISWADLDQGKVTPPFQPTVGEAEEATNFDSQFTEQPTDLPQLKMKSEVRKLAEEGFRRFSFYNENYDI
eukprot:GFUD01008305.1.p1 GENE.GFUD01008305.1~~GFUD01008305.1.p1  ORF type:complete len:665 (-),score=170.01 GFUD01008305.1:136-2130(-)